LQRPSLVITPWASWEYGPSCPYRSRVSHPAHLPPCLAHAGGDPVARGERKDRRFESSAPLQALFNFVDAESLGTPSIPSMHYSLVSNFPRTVHSRSQGARSLLEAGLHPQASLFVQMEEAGGG